MAKKRTPISFELHELYGKELLDMRNFLHKLLVRTSNHYGVTSKTAKCSQKMCHTIDDLRSELDDQFQRDCGDKYNFDVYYPLKNSEMKRQTIPGNNDSEQTERKTE